MELVRWLTLHWLLWILVCNGSSLKLWFHSFTKRFIDLIWSSCVIALLRDAPAPKILGERNPSGFLCPGSAPPRFFRRQTSDSSTIGTVIPCPSPQGDHQNFRSASIMKQVGDWIYSSYCKWYFQDNQQSTKYGQPLGMTAPEVVKPGCCLSACFAITWYVEKQMVLLYSQTSAKKCTLLGCTWYLTTPFKVALKYVEIQSSQSASPSVATAHLASAAGCSPPPGHGFAHDHMEVTRPRKLGSFTDPHFTQKPRRSSKIHEDTMK